MDKKICELFAGVGGFRVGFDKLNTGWETVWFNQWEPKTKKQWAHKCYVDHFGESKDINGNITTNVDIAMVDKKSIPDHNLLVAGFPCQDYSVARGLSKEKGITGKKGVLWWEIYKTISTKKPAFCLFENVDRLLKSPSKQRGRDFGIMLTTLSELGYSVEWRVVNAAQYGAAQRRKRVFIFAYRNSTVFYNNQKKLPINDILLTSGFFARTFPIKSITAIKSTPVPIDAVTATEEFSFDFLNAGIMTNGIINTTTVTEVEEAPITLGEILQTNVDENFYITEDSLEKWQYLKGAKRIPRVSANGHEYIYSEGPVSFPDSLKKPGRTMLTSESTINRSSHVIEDPVTKRLRIITPVEAERLQGFDDDWTNTGMTQRMRYFCMGNALVVPIVTRMGKTLDQIIIEEL